MIARNYSFSVSKRYSVNTGLQYSDVIFWLFNKNIFLQCIPLENN